MLLSGLLITGTIEAGGDSVQAASSSIETLIYGLFQFQIVAWVASMLIGHIHSMEQISSYGLDPADPAFQPDFHSCRYCAGERGQIAPGGRKRRTIWVQHVSIHVSSLLCGQPRLASAGGGILLILYCGCIGCRRRARTCLTDTLRFCGWVWHH